MLLNQTEEDKDPKTPVEVVTHVLQICVIV
jgi:hypothetical protein